MPDSSELSGPDREEDVLDLREIWGVITRGKWYIIASFIIVVGATVFFTYTTDPVYQSDAKVMLEQSKMSQGELASFVQNPLQARGQNELQNKLEIIQSKPVLEGAKELLENNKEFVRIRERERSDGSLIASALGNGDEMDREGVITTEDIEERMEARAIPDTDIIEVKATGATPRSAQIVANAIIDSYKQQELETSREDIGEVENFLDEQLKKMQNQLESSEKQALQFQKQTELMMGESGIRKKLNQLEEMKAEAEVTLADKEDKLESINKMLATVKQELFEEQFGAEGQKVINELQDKYIQVKKIRNDIQELEEERTEYLEEENYAKAQQLADQIKQKRKQYQEAATEEFSALGMLPRYEELITSQMEAEMEVKAAENRVQVIDRKIESEIDKLAEHGLQLLQYQRNLDINQEIYTLLRKEYERTRIAEAGELGGVRVVSRGSQPKYPIKPNKKRNILLAVVLGLAVGTGFAFVREYMDTSVRSPEDVEQLGLTNLGSVINIEKDGTGNRIEEIRSTLITNFGPKSRVVDSYTTLEANLRFLSVDEPLNSILLTSSIPGEGKTTTTINLGMTFAQMGKDTLIMDTDLRKHAFADIFDLPEEEGLLQLTMGQIDQNEAIKRPIIGEGYPIGIDVKEILLEHGDIKETGYDKALSLYQEQVKEGKTPRKTLADILEDRGVISKKELKEILIGNSKGQENLFVLPSGGAPPNPAAFLNSDGFQDTIRKLEERFDVILFDSSPVTSTPDPSILSSVADGTLLLISAEETSSDDVEAATGQLERAGARILGAVLNKVRLRKGGYGYYGYDYYYESEEE
ncbi:polysaccharide biosynthesis tyrosine autokinase [Candidatus Bipolaricaulota bacterium]|nr:polysaccharide biosynthesis tyrosine autokinase [Candidatus Bipolaricaulota bacterium]